MASIESSIVEVERQLGRELTPEEQHLMLYWYQMFGATAGTEAEQQPKSGFDSN